MKASTKIFLALSVIALCASCVIMFFLCQKSIVLVMYNPVTNQTKQKNIRMGDCLSKHLEVEDINGYEFADYYYSSEFSSKVDTLKPITKDSTVVVGYIKHIDDLSKAENNIVGVSYSGSLDNQKLSTLLNKNYKYLNFKNVEFSGTFPNNISALQTLYLPKGTISGANNYTNLKTIYANEQSQVIEAFNNCVSLENFVATNCQSIVNSFNNCPNMEALNIPKTLTVLEGSFINTNLREVTSNSQNFVIEGGVLYGKKGDQVCAIKALSNIKNINILSQTSSIADFAFYNHKNISSVTINAKVNSIGEYAFASSSIENINILQSTVLTISDRAFSECQKLSSINLGEGIKTIGEFAFFKTSIEDLNFEDSVLSNIKQYAFSECKSLKEVSFCSNQIEVGAGVFYGCENLVSVKNLHAENIAEKMFAFCSKLTNLSNFSNVQRIKNHAFLSCVSLENLTELVAVREFGIGCFENCKAIKEAKFINLQDLTKNMFLKCTSLQEFATAQSLQSFDASAFDSCEALKTLSFVSTKYICEDGVVYNLDKTELLYYLPTKTDSKFEILSSVQQVAAKYLTNNIYLEDIKAENDYYTSINGVLFTKDTTALVAYPSASTRSLYNVPEHVNTLKSHSFGTAPKLNILTISSSVKTIENGFLSPKLNLTTLNTSFIGESLSTSDSGFLGWFFGASNYSQNQSVIPTTLNTIIIADQESFGDYCFYDCSNLLTVELTSCEKLSKYMFYGCYELQTLTIGKPITGMDEYALYNCKNLISLTLTYNGALQANDIASTALKNTPLKSTTVTVYCNNPDISDFIKCFKDKQTVWRWVPDFTKKS